MLKNYTNRIFCLIAFFAFAAESSARILEDWPQWLGTNRDGRSVETGLLKSWPSGGPQELWRKSIGEGFSGIAVVGDRAFTMVARDGDEFAICLNASNGEETWKTRTGKNFRISWGNGPRATPVVDGNVVYVAGANASLFALAANSGEILWKKDLRQELGGTMPDLGYSNSPLIVDDLLLIPVGGGSGRGVYAFNKTTGEVVWKTHTDHPGYSSPVLATIHGVRQAVFFTGNKIVSVAPASGETLWQFSWRAIGYEAENVATPVFVSSNEIFFSSAHAATDKGAGVLRISKNGDRFEAKPAWQSNVMKNHFSTSVFHDGFIYGTDKSILKCIDSQTGEEKWRTRGYGEGSLIFADGHLYIMGTRGKLGLVEATSSNYREKSSFQAVRGKSYTPPSIANGRIYVRSQGEMACFLIVED